MGVLEFLGDKLDSGRTNLINVPLILAAAVGSVFGAANYISEDYDDGSENREQVMVELREDMATLSVLNQTSDIQNQVDILEAERAVAELKNKAEWDVLSDENKAYTRAREDLLTNKTFAAEEFKRAAIPVAQSLAVNMDISERDYATLRSEMLEIYNGQEIGEDASLPRAAYALRECQVESIDTKDISLSDNFKNVQSCMAEQDGEGISVLVMGVAGLFGTMFVGNPLLGKGLNAADRALDARRRRRKQKKLDN